MEPEPSVGEHLRRRPALARHQLPARVDVRVPHVERAVVADRGDERAETDAAALVRRPHDIAALAVLEARRVADVAVGGVRDGPELATVVGDRGHGATGGGGAKLGPAGASPARRARLRPVLDAARVRRAYARRFLSATRTSAARARADPALPGPRRRRRRRARRAEPHAAPTTRPAP